jgi:hypothetical protein
MICLILALIVIAALVRWDTPRQRDRFPFWEDDRWRPSPPSSRS